MRPAVRIDPFLEQNYNMQATRHDLADVMQNWGDRSQALRANSDASLDCRYGNHDRERIDIFRCGRQGAPLYVYLHGGYWQRGDKSLYSFIAEPFNAAGVDVAIIGYPLCPAVSMTALVDSIQRAILWLFHNSNAISINPDRINLSGHSAGGHLTAMMVCNDWRQTADDAPADLLKTGIPFSGLYDLAPLLQTSINDALTITPAELETLSPALQQPPGTAPLLLVVGGAETAEFFRQTDLLISRWHSGDRLIDRHVEPDVDHFDLVERLASSESQMFKRIIAWLR